MLGENIKKQEEGSMLRWVWNHPRYNFRESRLQNAEKPRV